MNLEQAIQAINDGKIVTHNFLEGKSLRRSEQYETSYEIVHVWNDKEDPLHKGTTYYKEYIFPVVVIDKNGETLGLGSIQYNWIDDADKRMMPTEGWEMLGEQI